jgi:hypothetical protein
VFADATCETGDAGSLAGGALVRLDATCATGSLVRSFQLTPALRADFTGVSVLG